MKQNAASGLDTISRELLNIIQAGFPLVPDPYAAIAGRLGVSEQEVIARIRALKEDGIIRRVGGIFDSGKLGFASTLVALKVEEEALEKVALTVSAHPGVTHNYQRAHEFNLWFTLVAASEEELEGVLDGFMAIPGVVKLRNLPALKLFKIGVNFDMSEGKENEAD